MGQLTGIAVVVVTTLVTMIGIHAEQSQSEAPGQQRAVPTSGSEDSDASRDVVTKVIADEPSRVKFVQASANGVYRDVTITWTLAATKKASADDHELLLGDGRRITVQRPTISTDATGLVITLSFDFFLPRETLPPEFPEPVRNADRSALATAARMIAEALTATARASGGDGLSGSFSSTSAAPPVRIIPHDPQLEAVRLERLKEAPIVENVQKLEEKLLGKTISTGTCTDPRMLELKDWMRRMQELHRKAAELGEGWLQQGALDASPEYRAVVAQRKAMLREPITPKRTAPGSSRYVRSADIAFATVQAKIIEEERQAYKERLAVLRRCHQNPTNLLAQKAKDEDRAAYERVEKALDAVELEVDIVSGMRQAATGLNAALGSELGFVGGAMTGVAGEIEDTLLKQSLDESLASLEKCVVRCCGEDTNRGQTTVGSDQSGAAASPPNFTPGPTFASPNFTPGPTQKPLPALAACKALSRVSVVYRYANGADSQLFSGTAPLKPVGKNDWNGKYVMDGYEGTGTGTWVATHEIEMPGTGDCPPGVNMLWLERGTVRLEVQAQFSVDNTITGGPDESMYDADTSEVDILMTVPVGLPWTQQGQECGAKIDDAGSYDLESSVDCHVYGANLYRGGVFFGHKDDELGHGGCWITLN